MLLSDLSSDQEATGSNSHGGGDMGGHVVLSPLFAPASAATLLLPPVAMEAPVEGARAKKKRSLPGNPGD
ncbi:hypothetical protein ABZP36_030696 [Zizania latifolia]